MILTTAAALAALAMAQVGPNGAPYDQGEAGDALQQIERNTEAIQRLEQALGQIEARGIAVEQSRAVRQQWLAEADNLLARAQIELAEGESQVDAELEAAQALLESDVTLALDLGSEQEADLSLQALRSLAVARAAIGQKDLWGARFQLIDAMQNAEQALTVARVNAQPLFRTAPVLEPSLEAAQGAGEAGGY
jgi:uncharacterized glyoxalase superfamily protein PhnB